MLFQEQFLLLDSLTTLSQRKESKRVIRYPGRGNVVPTTSQSVKYNVVGRHQL